MNDEQKTKLPTKTKIAALLLLIMAIIVFVSSIIFCLLMAVSGNVDISMGAPAAFSAGFGIALCYFLPSILLLKSRRLGLWLLSVIILCIGTLVTFLFMSIVDFLIPLLVSLTWLIPLVLIILDSKNYFEMLRQREASE